jgi:hypothetical protein
MPISNPIFAGLKRAYFSHKAMADTTLAAANVLVLNPLDGTQFMGPPKQDILTNANSAQGQGEWATQLTAGAKHLTGTHKYWLTSQALGMFAAMSTPDPGTDTTQVGGSGGDYQHWANVDSGHNTLLAHTVQEAYRGAAAPTTQAYKIKAVVCNGWTIDVSRGNQFATISADLIGNDLSSAAEDMSAQDISTYWPQDTAIPPTKCALYIDSTTGNNHTTKYSGSVSAPTAAGTPTEDLTGTPTKISTWCKSYSVSFANNISEADLFTAGTSTGAGFIADMVDVFPVARTCTVSMSLDLDNSATSLGLMEYLYNFTNNLQQSYTLQFSFTSDMQIASSGTYYGGKIIIPAARVVSATPTTNINGPLGLDVVMEGIAAYNYADDGYMLVYTYDGVSTSYYATS